MLKVMNITWHKSPTSKLQQKWIGKEQGRQRARCGKSLLREKQVDFKINLHRLVAIQSELAPCFWPIVP